MNHLRIASTLCWAYKMEDVLQIANQFQFGGVEVWAEHFWFHGSDPKLVNQIRKATDQKLTMHAASWDLNISALNQGIRQQSIDEIKKSIKLAKQIGADNITIHPGKMTLTSLGIPLHMDLLLESLQELVIHAQKNGVTLSLELMEMIHKEFIITPAVINQVTEAFQPYLSSTFDVAHIPQTEDIYEQWSQTAYVNKIHISDLNQHQFHLPLGDGMLAKDILQTFLKMENFPVIIEGFDQSTNLTWLHKNLQFISTYIARNNEEVIV